MQRNDEAPKPKQLLKLNLQELIREWKANGSFSADHVTIMQFLSHDLTASRTHAPGVYQVNQNCAIHIDCYAIARRDRYNTLKIDFFCEKNKIFQNSKSLVSPTCTLTCPTPPNNQYRLRTEVRRIVKKQSVALKNDVAKKLRAYFTHEYASKLIPSVSREVNRMISARFNEPRGPFYHLSSGPTPVLSGFFSMRFMPGNLLFYSTVANNICKTFDTRITMMMRCLHATDQSLFMRNMQHLDLKPDNMLLSTSKDHPGRIRIKLIDAECIHNMDATEPTCIIGTVGYVAPEYYLNRVIASNSDLYSLGIIFRVFSEDSNVTKFIRPSWTEALEREQYYTLKGEIPADFPEVKEVDAGIYHEYKNLLMQMTAADPMKRISVQACLSDFENLFIRYRVSLHPKEAEEKCAAVRAGVTSGFKFAKVCREYSVKELGNQTETLDQFINHLLNLASDSQTKNSDVAEFILVQDEPCLFNCTDFDEVSCAIKQIHSCLQHELTRWKLLGESAHIAKNPTALSHHKAFTDSVIAPTPLTLEALFALTEHIKRKYDKMVALYPPPRVVDDVSRDTEPESKRVKTYVADGSTNTESEPNRLKP